METLQQKLRPLIVALPQESQVQYDKQAQLQEVSEKANELGFFTHQAPVREQLEALQVLANRMGRYDAADSYSIRLSNLNSTDGKL